MKHLQNHKSQWLITLLNIFPLKKNFASILFLFVIVLQPLHAQWLKEKGKGFYKIGAWSLLADEHYTNEGKIDPNTTRGLFISSLYFQHGLSKKINLIGYIPFFVRNYQYDQVSKTKDRIIEKGQGINAFGDVNLGLEFKIKTLGLWHFSSTLTLGIPSGENKGGTDGSYQTGDGEFNQHVQVNAGTSFDLKGFPVYSKMDVGYNNRTKGFSDELIIGGETGVQLFKNKLLILARIRWIHPLYNGSLDATNSNGSVFANNVESLVLGSEVAWNFYKKIGVSFAYTVPVYGKIIYHAPSLSLGFYLNL